MDDLEFTIAEILKRHRFTEKYSSAKRDTIHVCDCGSQHPRYEGVWPTHTQHLAKVIASEVLEAQGTGPTLTEDRR